MISPKVFYDTLAAYGIDFYAGVPDSLLKNLCAYITDHADERHNIIAANEGGAMGLAAGHYLATGQIPVVYMQNSGPCLTHRQGCLSYSYAVGNRVAR